MKGRKCCLLCLFVVIGWACSEDRYVEPLSPEAALERFSLVEGFEIELFASEPDVMDPVEMIFDERGEVYVVEMPDYPYKPEPGKARGRIKKLIDEDADGRIDGSIVFAEGLSEATSILPWKDGLLVTAAPHIFYLRDTTGDYRVDTKEILFSGFFENNSEAQITNLRFSVDNWIYAANFGQPGEVTFHRRPDLPPLSMRGGDFRFRLDREQFELATGPTQFGQAINDWGHRFITQNTIHLRHAVIPYRYLQRNPHLPSKNGVFNISDHDLRMFQDTPPPYWRAERTRRRQKRYDEQNLDRVEYAEDHFTGASGATVYSAETFPKAYFGNVFIGDVAGNLVHRDVLRLLSDRPTYVASRGKNESDREFLSSTDSWFRPANFTLGPDGFLYVIDYYRQHIETPLSIPEDLKADMDFYYGDQHGRIYRIKPAGRLSNAQIDINLRALNANQLVALLGHQNQWWRLQAHRLLLEKEGSSVIPALTSLFAEHADARARLHALYALEGQSALDAELIRNALEDEHPRVREHAVQLAEQSPTYLPNLLRMVDDPDLRVALQVCLSLGYYSGTEVVDAQIEFTNKYGEDQWFQKAILSSSTGTSPEFLKELVKKTAFFQQVNEDRKKFLEDYAYVQGADKEAADLEDFLQILAGLPERWHVAGLKGLASGLKKSTTKDKAISTHWKDLLHNFKANGDDEVQKLLEEMLAHPL